MALASGDEGAPGEGEVLPGREAVLPGGDPVPSRTGPVTLGPVAVRRRCRLPGSVLTELGSDRVWQSAGAWADAEDAALRLGGALADHLGTLVPTAPKEPRRDLLRARRAAFHARTLPVRPLPAGPAADAYTENLAAEYARVLEARESARRDLDAALGTLARTAGATVDAVLDDPDLAWSVELSVPGLLEAGPVGALDATAGRKARRRALTLLRLVQRAATKATPFAGFAATHLLFRDGVESAPRSHVRVDRGAVERVRQWVADGGYRSLRPERLWLTANPSAMIREHDDGPRVTWLVTRGNGMERFGSARCGPALARTLHRLRDPVRLDTVTKDGALPGTLETLVRRGLLEVGPALPTHGWRTLHAAADATAPGPRAEGEEARIARDVHDSLCVLRDAEDALDGAGRGGALRRAREGISALARTLSTGERSTGGWRGDGQGGGRAPVGAVRCPVSEDVVGLQADDGILRTSTDVLADLGRVQRIVPLLSYELPFQLATAIAFRRRFGLDPVPLPAAYQWFLESGRKESDALLADCRADELVAVLGLRRRLFEGLREAADRPGTEVRCDPGLLDAVAAGLPDAVMDLPCAAWPVQPAGNQVVVNGVGSGYGRFAARVAAGLDDVRTAELRGWAAAAHTPLEGGIAVDVSALLGATVNEHPLLLPAALSYPGRALECAPHARIDLSEVVVRAVGGRLLLFGERFPGRPLFPVPHNATLSAVAPGLYRWLSRFGPPSGATLDLWDHVDALAGPEAPVAVRHYPRLTLGRLVLCRRTWKVPGAALPAVTPSGTAQGARAWYRWCASTGVPRRSFLRTTTLPDPWDVVRGKADKRPVLAARSSSGAAIRKPLYVDLSQPLCWPAATAAAGDTLTFTEPLPDPVGTARGGRVTEYVLETSQPPS
ncbi:lantibiotic dehydratase [Streptomyces sp. MUM 203J]|uniref:lantibiotic dehydratase n=1 Tax=Streptomyces sp. MUM 203J TaxID=2791990 RepID=UPI001F04E67C|nr:lantibiotic dehydratase [Streptomyces sp. MUM 203J]MCH0541438.1 lantibiotic dehydratase [Streptomyces sp. MUM 203J]